MKKFGKKLVKAGKVTAICGTSLFAASLVVYYFNLDMKAASILDKPLDWHYNNNIKRNRSL